MAPSTCDSQALCTPPVHFHRRRVFTKYVTLAEEKSCRYSLLTILVPNRTAVCVYEYFAFPELEPSRFCNHSHTPPVVRLVPRRVASCPIRPSCPFCHFCPFPRWSWSWSRLVLWSFCSPPSVPIPIPIPNVVRVSHYHFIPTFSSAPPPSFLPPSSPPPPHLIFLPTFCSASIPRHLSPAHPRRAHFATSLLQTSPNTRKAARLATSAFINFDTSRHPIGPFEHINLCISCFCAFFSFQIDRTGPRKPSFRPAKLPPLGSCLPRRALWPPPRNGHFLRLFATPARLHFSGLASLPTTHVAPNPCNARTHTTATLPSGSSPPPSLLLPTRTSCAVLPLAKALKIVARHL